MNQIHQWIQRQLQQDNFSFAGFIANELLEANQSLDFAIYAESFADSFSRTQVIIGLEVWTPQMLEQLHRYLSYQCCNITNFTLIVIGHPRIASWWQQHQNLYQTVSYRIIEVRDFPFLANKVQPLARQSIDQEVWGRHVWYPSDTCNIDIIQNPVLYMAGTLPGSFDGQSAKTYLLLTMAKNRPRILVDRCWALPDKQEFASWLDYATHWQDQTHVEDMTKVFDQEALEPYYANAKLTSMQASVDLYPNSFASVVRETVMTLPYGCISEKTFKAYMFQQFVIPTTYCGVSDLENCGFMFDHDFFDFDYQYIADYVARIRQLQKQVAILTQRPISDLELHRQTRRYMYEHNQRRALELTQLE